MASSAHTRSQGVGADESMVDGWMGDDWFHYGPSVSSMQLDLRSVARARGTKSGDEHNDEYYMFMQARLGRRLGRRRGLDQLGFWKKLVEHPATTHSGAIRPLTSCWPSSR